MSMDWILKLEFSRFTMYIGKFKEKVIFSIYSDTQSKWVLPEYTVKFDTDGADSLADKTVKWTDTVLDGISSPTKSGWEFVEWKYGDVTVKSDTTYADLVKDDSVKDITLTAKWKDIEKPVISDNENEKTYCSVQTDDNNRLTLWIAFFFVSGGLLGTTAYRRKKKYSVK